MAGVNFAVLVGHLGADPEMHNTQDGRKIARFRIATSESWKDRNTGEKRERTEWHTIVVFSEGLAGVVESYVRKGSKVFVKGIIRTRDWDDQQGVKRWTTEIHLSGFDAQLVLLDRAGSGRPPMPDGAGEGAGPGYGAGSDDAARQQMSNTVRGEFNGDVDDEIPF